MQAKAWVKKNVRCQILTVVLQGPSGNLLHYREVGFLRGPLRMESWAPAGQAHCQIFDAISQFLVITIQYLSYRLSLQLSVSLFLGAEAPLTVTVLQIFLKLLQILALFQISGKSKTHFLYTKYIHTYTANS